VPLSTLDGAVSLVTGGASGIGAAVARRLAAEGGRVVVADRDTDLGQQVADDVGGTFVEVDVTDPQAQARAVALAEERHGGLDLAFLNAGVEAGPDVTVAALLEGAGLANYRRVMGVNIDGVVFGVAAAAPALRRRGGGAIVATASLAGLVGLANDPVYTVTKHGVVGLVRAVGPVLAPEGIITTAVCPSFADTPLVARVKESVQAFGVDLLTPDEVADAVLAAATSTQAGACWWVQPGRPSEPFRFQTVPGPRPRG